MPAVTANGVPVTRRCWPCRDPTQPAQNRAAAYTGGVYRLQSRANVAKCPGLSRLAQRLATAVAMLPRRRRFWSRHRFQVRSHAVGGLLDYG